MDRTGVFIIAVAGVLGALLVAKFQQDMANRTDLANDYASDTSTPTDTSFTEDIMTTLTNIPNTFTRALGLWSAPAAYAQAIAEAEAQNGIPPRMLERQLWQECRWRADIISGRTRSPAGAVGIAQFMPDTAREMGVDPLDPIASIYAAGRYMAGLYRKFGNWSEALASYNWGQGNVARKGLANAPLETRNYYGQILADVNSATGSNYA